MRTSNIQLIVSLFLGIMIFLFSCEKIENTYSEFVKNGETVYVAKADSIKVHNGLGRVEISWLLLSDPKVRSYKLYWDNRKDSVEGSVQKTTNVDTIRVMLDNMEEGVHYFEIYMYDKDGHSSVAAEAIGNVYGKVYKESLLTRTFKNMSRLDDSVVIEWSPSAEDMIGVEVKYPDKNGNLITHFVPSGAEYDTLPNVPAYGTLKYRTGFLPDSLALDTLYTSYTTIELDERDLIGMNMSFTTAVRYGDQEDQLSILVSTDFNGVYEIDDIHTATWTDITDDFPLATGSSAKDWGEEDLVPYMEKGKPIYIAFRYITLPQAENGNQRSWYIRHFEVITNNDDLITDLSGADFELVQGGPFESGRSEISSSTITFRGNKSDTESRTESWAVSKAINF